MTLFMHDRESGGDLMKILGDFPNLPPIVIHCFTGTQAEAEEFVHEGYYIGLTGFLVMKRRAAARQAS